jgi:DNA-directed RNA polymerase subunit RPC12/RpoP
LTKENKRESRTDSGSKKIEKCPHCGIPLTQWEQVILSIDRVLTCKKCWYRIILDVYDEGNDKISGDKK